MSLSSEVAWRYLRRGSSRLVSRVSVLAAGGIALGVMALAIAMGLLAGYRGEIAEKLVAANAEVVVFPLSPAGLSDPEALAVRLARCAHVRAQAPVIYGQGMAVGPAAADGVAVVLKGIDPRREAQVASIDRVLGDAAAAFAPGPDGMPGCEIGADLARQLGVRAGGTVVLAVPDASRRGVSFALRRRPFRVSRVFRTNFFEYDASWVFLDRAAARDLLRLPAPANVLEIALDSPDSTEEAAAQIREIAGDRYSVADWRSLNGGLFSALAIQKVTLFLLIGLIVAVATFNIVAALVMNVQEKRRDIGVWAALGAAPSFASRVFLRLGLLLGGAGVAAGLALGLAVCRLVTRLRLVSFPPSVARIYFLSFVPFRLRASDAAAIAAFSFAVVLLAAWLSARRASRLDVAEALRYE